MDSKIIYDSTEISNIVSKINENTSIIDENINNSLNNDFTLLQELGFFNEGLDSLKKVSSKVESLNNRLVFLLKDHDSNINELNKKHLALLDDIENEDKIDIIDDRYIEIEDIELNKIVDGKLILNEYVSNVLPNFSYEVKKEIIKDILNNDENSLSVLTDKNQSDILIYKLKELLNNKYSMELSKLSKEEEQEIQKMFFDAISDNDTNIFSETNENSFLHGLAYFKQVSKINDISVADLLFDENNNKLFLSSLNELYNCDEMDILTSEELISVKNYVNGIAEKNNISTLNLLQEEKYCSVLKGGIYYED